MKFFFKIFKNRIRFKLFKILSAYTPVSAAQLNGNQRWNVPAVVPLHGVTTEANFQQPNNNGDRTLSGTYPSLVWSNVFVQGGNVTSLNVNDDQLVDEQRLFPPMPDAPVKE